MPKVNNSASIASGDETQDLVVVGSGGVGKSCLTVRFLKDEFSNEYDPTIEENYRKNIVVDKGACVVNIIDTAGQHEYTSLRDQHLKAGKGFLLVFSLTDAGSFDELKQLRDQIIKLKDTKKVPIVVCGNKADIPVDQHEVTQDTVNTFLSPLRIPYLQTSAKDNINVTEAFLELVRECRRMDAAKTGKDSKYASKESVQSAKSNRSKASGKKAGGGGGCVLI
ncbi:ras family-domain-containing protein [Obelidium mucronatum]|nr:ras family-domain-containing protein [Obelidium mucronatum]